MLVLSRMVDEVVTIGDDTEVTVVAIRFGDEPKVRLGITAPKDVAVHRKETYAAIKREGRLPKPEPATLIGMPVGTMTEEAAQNFLDCTMRVLAHHGYRVFAKESEPRRQQGHGVSGLTVEKKSK